MLNEDKIELMTGIAMFEKQEELLNDFEIKR